MSQAMVIAVCYSNILAFLWGGGGMAQWQEHGFSSRPVVTCELSLLLVVV